MNKFLYLLLLVAFSAGCVGTTIVEKKQSAKTPEEAFSIYRKAMLEGDLSLYHSITHYDKENVKNIDFEFRGCRMRTRNRAAYEKKFSINWVDYFFEINGKALGAMFKAVSPFKESESYKRESYKKGTEGDVTIVYFQEESGYGFRFIKVGEFWFLDGSASFFDSLREKEKEILAFIEKEDALIQKSPTAIKLIKELFPSHYKPSEGK